MEINVDVQINRKVKTTEDNSFLSGVVYFTSSISMSIPDQGGVAAYPISAEVFGSLLQKKGLVDATRVNLSRQANNPDCNMRIERLDAHNSHAPTFSFQGDMEDYIDRVITRVNLVVDIIDNEALSWTSGEDLPKLSNVPGEGNGYWAINPDQGGE